MKTFTVRLVFDTVSADDAISAAKAVCGWVTEDAHTMVYEVSDDETGAGSDIDLQEVYENEHPDE